MRKIAEIIALAALGVIATAPAALASQPQPVVRHSIVTYDDLNLATKQGDQTLVSRITRAATRDCGGFPTDFGYAAARDFDQCRSAAEQGAIKQIHNSGVTQLFDKETGAKL